ncbi:MAG: hypothetical protein J07HQX50_02363 [Haloquadratum sp. J07HQX50]|nr:MAG: hypothetical protein J07HQX50_02363 [Haloquadratum sp. J07HQX50]
MAWSLFKHHERRINYGELTQVCGAGGLIARVLVQQSGFSVLFAKNYRKHS